MFAASGHPLAAGIVAGAKERKIQLSPVEANSPMCAAALIDNGFSRVAGPRRRVSFHSEFSRQLGPQLCAFDCVFLPYRRPRFRLVLVSRKGPSNKGAPLIVPVCLRGRGDKSASSNGQRPDRKCSMLPTNSAEVVSF